MPPKRGLLERLTAGETIIVAEGYIFAFERLCYLQAGPFVPEVVVEHPELVKQMYRDFVRAGSDVVQALTYYAHRSKMSLVSRADDLEKANRLALRMAREIADETGALMCGDICNTGQYTPGDEVKIALIKDMFKEQVEWATEEGADFIVAETFANLGEAMLALDAIKKYGKGLPAVVTLTIQTARDGKGQLCTNDRVEATEAMRKLEEAGADVVGLNCSRGPDTILSLMKNAKKSGIKIPLAVLPVPYRTTEGEPTFMTLKDPKTGRGIAFYGVINTNCAPGNRCFPLDLDCRLCTRSDIVEFGKRCAELGIPYVGLCCGNSPHFTRSLAESLGRKPEGSRYSPNMSLHVIYGSDDKLNAYEIQSAT